MKPVIFFAFANDNETPRHYLSRLQHEYEAVYDALHERHQADDIEIHRIKTASAERIFRDIIELRQRVAIFHYGGHADGLHLQLEDINVRPQLVRAQGLAGLLGMEPNLQLVFLNGCSTAGQVSALLEAGVKAVIATTTAVNDTLAGQFAEYFYKALANNKTIEEAFKSARAFIETINGNPEIIVERDIQRLAKKPASQEIPWGLYINDHGNDVLPLKLDDFNAGVNIRTAQGTLSVADFSDLYVEDNALTIFVITASLANMETISDPVATEAQLKERYGGQAREWRPYLGSGTLEELIKEYHRVSGFRINLLVIDRSVIRNSATLKKIRARTLLMVDALSLYLSENQVLARVFDDPDIGGCIVPVCATLPAGLRESILLIRDETFADLNTYYLNFKEECVYIELHVPTKEDLFRRLTNMAIMHLEKVPQYLNLGGKYDKFRYIGKLNAEFKKQ